MQLSMLSDSDLKRQGYAAALTDNFLYGQVAPAAARITISMGGGMGAGVQVVLNDKLKNYLAANPSVTFSHSVFSLGQEFADAHGVAVVPYTIWLK